LRQQQPHHLRRPKRTFSLQLGLRPQTLRPIDHALDTVSNAIDTVNSAIDTANNAPGDLIRAVVEDTVAQIDKHSTASPSPSAAKCAAGPDTASKWPLSPPPPWRHGDGRPRQPNVSRRMKPGDSSTLREGP